MPGEGARPEDARPANAALLRSIGNPAACTRTTDDGTGYNIDITFDEAARLRALADVLGGITRRDVELLTGYTDFFIREKLEHPRLVELRILADKIAALCPPATGDQR